MTINEELIIKKALDSGFNAAAFMDAADLLVVPDYRKYCEMNLCGCYGTNPLCPPASGTVEEMTARIRACSRVLVLQTVVENSSMENPKSGRDAKIAHNNMADSLIDYLKSDLGIKPEDMLRMSAGPWKQSSCMSAYCVDAQNMADKIGMDCWKDDGKSRFFSEILFK